MITSDAPVRKSDLVIAGWEVMRLESARLSMIANTTFLAGDLIEMTRYGLVQLALLLSNPDEGRPVRAIYWDEDAPAEPFEGRIPVDFLGKYGRLLWRAGAA